MERLAQLVVFVTLLVACGGEGDGEASGASANSGGVTGSGGSSGGGGTSSGGSTGSPTRADHEAACRDFCAGFEAHCGDYCPEICDGHANTHGEFCANFGVIFFDCLSALDPSLYDCEAGTFRNVADVCETEQSDIYACSSLDGERCERAAMGDDECSEFDPAKPFRFSCVSTVVPAACSALRGSLYCCPNE